MKERSTGPLPILVVTVGLPYCGKSTWAEQQGCPIVSPDAIRFALHGQRYIQLAEPFVWATAETMVRALFIAGHPQVILDATNITRARRERWISVGKPGHPAEWRTRFQTFAATVEECIARAGLNADAYILPTIQRMAAEYEPLTAEEAVMGHGV